MPNQVLCKGVYASFCLGSHVLSLCIRCQMGPPAASYSQVLTVHRLIPCRCSGLHRPQTEAEVLEQSAQTLRAHLVALLSAICRSVRTCPAVVRATFRQLFRRVRERFPSAQHQVRPTSAELKAGAGRESCGTDMLLDQSLLLCTLPERTIHRGHQLPVPALLLSRHPVAQALPLARAACRCSHQPHTTSAGQGVGLQIGTEKGS